MACSSSIEDIVVLELTDPLALEDQFSPDEISISTSDIQTWNLDYILCSKTVKVLTNRSRLVQESSYFRGLLGGSFRDPKLQINIPFGCVTDRSFFRWELQGLAVNDNESGLHHVSIQWNVEAVLSVLQFLYSYSLHVTSNNFLLLLEAALFFGVDKIFLKCETWFSHITSVKGLHTPQMPLEAMIEIWKFGWEHGIFFVQDRCEHYLAQHFAWATSCSSFADIPYSLLRSCLDHPQLTVESEKQLCEALEVWLVNNTKLLEGSSGNSSCDYFSILKKVKVCLLPLGYAAGLRRRHCQFADEAVCAILKLIKDCSSSLMHAITHNETDKFKIRLTEYSEKIVLSGCTQLTIPLLFLAVLPPDLDVILKARVVHSFTELDSPSDYYQIVEKHLAILSLKHVQEVDISGCPKLHFSAAIMWLHLAFPSLKILKASHTLYFTVKFLLYLIRKCHHISEIDLTVDVSPVTPTISVLSATAEAQLTDDKPYKSLEETSLSNIGKYLPAKPPVANILKLTLEGRTDINDFDMSSISVLSDSLAYLNIKGCTMVTDIGISRLICKCRKIHSLAASYTSFGRTSILALCSSHTYLDVPGTHSNHKYSDMMAFGLQQLHLDGCKGIDQNSMTQLMSHTFMLKILSLRDTFLIDEALYEFMGSSLESLDVSETMVSAQALTYVIKRNLHLRCLKAASCRNLHKFKSMPNSSSSSCEDLFLEIGKKCILEEVAFGWGFSYFQLEMLKPAISKLKAITVGMGATLDNQTLCMIPKLCLCLESVTLIFQKISDELVRSMLHNLKHLQVLRLRCCLGDLTSFSFQINMPSLRTLKLEWVTPWMTNTDLAVLTQNCPKLVELSLSGCKLLDSYSQEIISSGWPGLTLIHLENCGKVTSTGVSFLFNCLAVEDLLLRHNGRGLGRNFISDATSKLPLLRKLAVDLCDSCEGGFDSPSPDERLYLRNVRISRCVSHRCGFEIQSAAEFKPVHKETIVLEWTSRELRTTIVKERI